MTDHNISAAASKPPAPTLNIAKGQVDGALTFLESAKAVIASLDNILAAGVEPRPELLSGITDAALMLLGQAEGYARLSSQTLDALNEGDAK